MTFVLGLWAFLARYVRNVLIVADNALNVVVFFGDPDETVSSVAAKKSQARGWSVLARLLERIDPGHLDRAREDDEGDNAASRLWGWWR